MQLLILDLGAYFFIYFFFPPRSQERAAYLHAAACPSLSPPRVPGSLFWAVFLNLPPNPAAQTLPRGAVAPPGAPCTRNVARVCPVSAAFAPPGGAGPPARAMPHGRVSRPPPTPMPAAAFSLSQQRRENSALQSAGCFPRPALLKDGVYIAPLHPGSAQPRAAFG